MNLYEGKVYKCLLNRYSSSTNKSQYNENKFHYLYSISAKGAIIPNYPTENQMARTLVDPMEIKIIKKLPPQTKLHVSGCREKVHIAKVDLLIVSLSSPFSNSIKNHQHYITKESELHRLICCSPQIIKDITPPFNKGDTVIYIDKMYGPLKVKIVSIESPMPGDDERFYGIQFRDGKVRDVPGITLMPDKA